MATRTSSRPNQRHSRDPNNVVEDAKSFVEEHDVKEMTHDLAEYLTNYARENPGTSALVCLGLGFVLGWKLKPW